MQNLPQPAGYLDVVQDALARIAVIVTEIELGETSIAYAVATDLELDLERAVRREPTPLRDLSRAA
jgi:hypothetical protein